MFNQVSKRGFLNKKSNYWVRSLLQVLQYSPPPVCLAIFKELFTVTLSPSFQNMSKDTNACLMEMNLSLNLHINELFKNIILNFIENQSIANEVPPSLMSIYAVNEDIRIVLKSWKVPGIYMHLLLTK